MSSWRCIQKFRDRNGVIKSYLIVNLSDPNRCLTLDSNSLKEMIRKGKISVDNLTLTKDNRLFERGVIQESLDKKNSNIKATPDLVKRSAPSQEITNKVYNELYAEKEKQEAIIKRKKSFRKTMNFMKEVGSIMFTGKTLEEREKEKARYNRQVSWEHNYREPNEYFGTASEYGGSAGEYSGGDAEFGDRDGGDYD